MLFAADLWQQLEPLRYRIRLGNQRSFPVPLTCLLYFYRYNRKCVKLDLHRKGVPFIP